MIKVSALAAAVAALVAAWGPWAAHGTLAAHMLQHLVVMNGAALLLAVALRPQVRGVLAIATVLQIVLLWGWHLPAVFETARHSALLTLLMQASLLAVSFLFWSAVLAHPVERSWQTILAALVTAKSFCLFGAVLCFARRPLYAAHADHGAGGLEDQQLAGVLMMASCAVVYVVAAIVLFLRWMSHMDRRAAGGAWRPVDA